MIIFCVHRACLVRSANMFIFVTKNERTGASLIIRFLKVFLLHVYVLSEYHLILHAADFAYFRHCIMTRRRYRRVIIVEKSFPFFVPFMVKHDRLSSA